MLLIWKFLISGLLLNYQQTASYRRNKNQTAKHWVNRRGGGVDANLTYDNKKFLDQVVIDKFSQDSPLKLAPWKRGQFNKDSVYLKELIFFFYKMIILIYFFG